MTMHLNANAGLIKQLVFEERRWWRQKGAKGDGEGEQINWLLLRAVEFCATRGRETEHTRITSDCRRWTKNTR